MSIVLDKLRTIIDIAPQNRVGRLKKWEELQLKHLVNLQLVVSHKKRFNMLKKILIDMPSINPKTFHNLY